MKYSMNMTYVIRILLEFVIHEKIYKKAVLCKNYITQPIINSNITTKKTLKMIGKNLMYS